MYGIKERSCIVSYKQLERSKWVIKVKMLAAFTLPVQGRLLSPQLRRGQQLTAEYEHGGEVGLVL